MKKALKENFVSNVEKLINPVEVGTIHFVHGINRMLSIGIQNKLSELASKNTPIMGFVVEPYSSFLCYELLDLHKANELIPDGFRLVKTKIFETDEEEKYYVIFGSIRAHTSAFWGARMEFYIIGEDIKTGLLTWIIIDYDTDTVAQDKKHGLREANSKDAVVTTDYNGKVIVSIKNEIEKRELIFNCDSSKGILKPIYKRLWIEGNLSITYGKELSNGKARPFGLIFEPEEMDNALSIPLSATQITSNSWYPNMISKKPISVVVFPYAQHFLANTSDKPITIKNVNELRNASKNIDFKEINTISASGFKYLIMGIIFFLIFIIFILILLLIF